MNEDRRRTAIWASRCWYQGVFAAHGIPTTSDERMWVALGDPPPFHSVVKTLMPDVSADEVLEAMQPHTHGSVADSFGTLPLADHGFGLLFEASWVHHPGRDDASWPDSWRVVTSARLLTDWSHHHDYVGVLPESVLSCSIFRVLARVADGELIGGAVLHDAGEVAGMSNLWTKRGAPDPEMIDDVLACASQLFPSRPVTDYTHGDEREALLSVGFTRVGTQLVWAR